MPTKLFRVMLDTTSDPPVLVDPVAWGRNYTRLMWRRQGGTPTFDFQSFSYYTGSSISSPVVTATSIRADNDDTNISDDHEYIITVVKNGIEYSSTKSSGPPTGDKPVIRN